MDEELSKNYFEATFLQASEHFAKGHLMFIPQAAASLKRRAGQSHCKTLHGNPQRCTLLICIRDCFFYYDLLNPIPDEHAESSPWWQVKKP